MAKLTPQPAPKLHQNPFGHAKVSLAEAISKFNIPGQTPQQAQAAALGIQSGITPTK